MQFFIGRIQGPEIRAEARLRRRAAEHLNTIQKTLTDFGESRDQRYWEDKVGDLLGELSFNIRRLVEISREQAFAKNLTLGFVGGKKSASLWDFLGVCQHLLAFHALTGESGEYDDTSMLVVHSESRSIGVYFKDLMDVVTRVIKIPSKSHFGLFSEDMASMENDAEGRPVFNIIISSRRRAILIDDFFWTPLEVISPGLSIKSEVDLPPILQANPLLLNDAIFVKARASAFWVERGSGK